jgi:zinc transport system permease protein
MSVWDALPILQNGILACLVSALVCSFLGVYVILKRVVFVTAALSQVSSLGIAGALFVVGFFGLSTDPSQESVVWPLVSAIGLSCVVASTLAFQHTERRLTRESLLGIGYAVPAAVALLILDRVGGATHDIDNLLFGNAVFVSNGQLLFLIGMAAVVLLLHRVLYNPFIFVSFDHETAKASGMRTGVYNQLLFASMAVTVAVGISSIGALPVFAFMVVPAAAALMLTRNLRQTFVLSVLFGTSAALIGFYISFRFSLPTGPSMIAVAALYLLPGLTKTSLGPG